MKGISKSFPGVKALNNIDFSVLRGEVHCLLGANGAGKSTLIKILAGAYPKDQGEIFFEGRPVDVSNPLVGRKLGITVIYQELSLIPTLSVAENIFIGKYPRNRFGSVDWNELYLRAQELLDELGVDINVRTAVGMLSVGHQQIVEIAKSMASQARLIVMDEPSAALTGNEFETLVRVIEDLKSRGITIMYVSHRLEEVFRVGDRATILRDGKLVAVTNVADVTRSQLTELIVGHPLVEHQGQDKYRHGKEIFRVEGLNTPKLQSISMAVHEGEILGLFGLVGSGRTELLKAIFGCYRPLSGQVYLEGTRVSIGSPREAIKAGMALVPEDRKLEGLVLGLSIWENAALPSLADFAKPLFINYRGLIRAVAAFVDRLRVAAPALSTTVSSLSGGNQQKIVLAKWLLKRCRLILLDEPTRGIDIGAKDEVYSITCSLASEGRAVIMASSDVEELLAICHRILVLREGQLVGEFYGSQATKEALLHYAIAGGQ